MTETCSLLFEFKPQQRKQEFLSTILPQTEKLYSHRHKLSKRREGYSHNTNLVKRDKVYAHLHKLSKKRRFTFIVLKAYIREGDMVKSIKEHVPKTKAHNIFYVCGIVESCTMIMLTLGFSMATFSFCIGFFDYRKKDNDNYYYCTHFHQPKHSWSYYMLFY